jgi:hypothetical protein
LVRTRRHTRPSCMWTSSMTTCEPTRWRRSSQRNTSSHGESFSRFS